MRHARPHTHTSPAGPRAPWHEECSQGEGRAFCAGCPLPARPPRTRWESEYGVQKEEAVVMLTERAGFPPSSAGPANGDPELAFPPSSTGPASGDPELAFPPSNAGPAKGGAGLVFPPSSAGPISGGAGLAFPPSRNRTSDRGCCFQPHETWLWLLL